MAALGWRSYLLPDWFSQPGGRDARLAMVVFHLRSRRAVPAAAANSESTGLNFCHTGVSDISASLVAAYRATEYRVGPETGSDGESGTGSSRTFILRIDQYSESLSRLFAASGHQCAAFITACNPFSVPQSREANHAVCARLRDELIRHAAHTEQIVEGEGRDPSGAWPGEKSFLALGLDLETSQVLGRKFGQNAIVWAGADAIPRLILLR